MCSEESCRVGRAPPSGYSQCEDARYGHVVVITLPALSLHPSTRQPRRFSRPTRTKPSSHCPHRVGEGFVRHRGVIEGRVVVGAVMDAATGHPRIEGRKVTGAAEAEVSLSCEFRPGT